MRPQTFASLKHCRSLNPYYTGSYSMRSKTIRNTTNKFGVLILIILEVTL